MSGTNQWPVHNATPLIRELSSGHAHTRNTQCESGENTSPSKTDRAIHSCLYLLLSSRRKIIPLQQERNTNEHLPRLLQYKLNV